VQAVREGPGPAHELCEYLLDRFDVDQAGDDLTILIADIDRQAASPQSSDASGPLDRRLLQPLHVVAS
jgi:hypothetical protein